ncbi:MAG: helix-turn-helix domain-containing protein [Collinsella sp.]|nr:helix-turn-helix domain-containing protein [Collinsella sp.]
MVSGRRGRFGDLPEERRRAVIDAAAEVFGSCDYAHASTADIARRAGMSKSLLFFYFRNKRELYLHVLGVLTRRVANMVVDERWWQIDDFFGLVGYAAERKASVARLDPRVMSFFVRAFYPRHREVSGALDAFMRDAVPVMVETYLGHVRWDRFRDDVDPMRVVRMLVWAGDGFLHEQLRSGGEPDMEALLLEFSLWLDLLRRATYKEEWL